MQKLRNCRMPVKKNVKACFHGLPPASTPPPQLRRRCSDERRRRRLQSVRRGGGLYEDAWVAHFVRGRPPRRPPLINLGEKRREI